MPMIQTIQQALQACTARLRQHRRAAGVAAAVLGTVGMVAALTYIQPRQHSLTQQARFLADDAWIARQFKIRGLQAQEIVLIQSGQDTSYTATARDAWGSYALKGSVTVMPSSGGAHIIWTLEHDAGYHPVQRWLAATRMATQQAALQARLQAFKDAVWQAANGLPSPKP